MRFVIGLLVCVFILNIVLIGLGVVTGLLLRLVFPSIEWGMSVLIGLLSSVFSILSFVVILWSGGAFDSNSPPRKAAKESCVDSEQGRPASESKRTWRVPSIELPTRTNWRQSS